MPKIKVVNENKAVHVELGEDMRIALEKTKILFGCLNGECGVCCIKIIEGEENFYPMKEKEKKTLDELKAEKGMRLACQCRIKGDCSIKYINSCG